MNQVHLCHPLLPARDWQHRPQLDDVCRWWIEGGSGVCALIGIGGAGKTAIADRFLQMLREAVPPSAELPQRLHLRRPKRLFVFSFYDTPNPDSFFQTLFDFLSASPSDPVTSSQPTANYQQTLLALQSSGRCLLVLDGLEKVQDDGVRGGIFGELQDWQLSDLLRRVTEGYLPQVSVLITSRFPLLRHDERRSAFYREIAVEEIDSAAAVALLRQRGLRGTDDELRSIATDCGHHALTLALMASYVSTFHGGTPAELGKELRIRQFPTSTEKRIEAVEQVGRLRALGATPELAKALNRLGVAENESGRTEVAIQTLYESLALTRTIGDQVSTSRVLNNLALCLDRLGETGKARQNLIEAIRISRAIGDSGSLATALGNLAAQLAANYEFDEARRYLEEVVAIAERENDQKVLATTLSNLSTVLHEMGSAQEALELLRRACEISENLGDTAGTATILNNLSSVLLQEEHYAEAELCVRRAISLRRQSGDIRGEVMALTNLGRLLAARNCVDQAIQLVMQAQILAESIGDDQLVADLSRLQHQVSPELHLWRLGLDTTRQTVR